MTQISHPLGLRLGISSLWKVSVNYDNYRDDFLHQIFLYHWFHGFFKKHKIYLFALHRFNETRFFLYYYLLFLFDYINQKRNNRKRRFLIFQPLHSIDSSLILGKKNTRVLFRRQWRPNKRRFFWHWRQNFQKILYNKAGFESNPYIILSYKKKAF